MVNKICHHISLKNVTLNYDSFGTAGTTGKECSTSAVNLIFLKIGDRSTSVPQLVSGITLAHLTYVSLKLVQSVFSRLEDSTGDYKRTSSTANGATKSPFRG